MRVHSTKFCGFNQSEMIFQIWSVVVSNQISSSRFGNFLHIVVINHKNVHLCYGGVSNKRILLWTQIFQISEKIHKINRKNFAVKIDYIAELSIKRKKINTSSISQIFYFLQVN